MKPITLTTLRKLAALINASPRDVEAGPSSEVTFGCQNPEAVSQIAAMDGATNRATYYPAGDITYRKTPIVIFSATVRVDGVYFRAQWSRDATEAEIARHAPIADELPMQTYKPAAALTA